MSLGTRLFRASNTVCVIVLRLLDIHLHTTRLSLRTSFDQQAAGAVLDMEGDEEAEMKKSKSLRKWYSTAFGYVTISLRGMGGRVRGEIYGGKFTMGKRVEGGRGRFFSLSQARLHLSF